MLAGRIFTGDDVFLVDVGVVGGVDGDDDSVGSSGEGEDVGGTVTWVGICGCCCSRVRSHVIDSSTDAIMQNNKIITYVCKWPFVDIISIHLNNIHEHNVLCPLTQDIWHKFGKVIS